MTKVPDSEENAKKCICGGCPTYNDCMRERMLGLFCSKGMADCDIARNGCLCGACPLASDFRLDRMYYCSIGSAE